MDIKKPKVIAFYLPQYHPIPENDQWWGKGFTEWTNVVKTKPLFKGHYQPKIPADLGFYDLRLPETRIQQAALAKEFGIDGFCYWHYWFGGKRLLNQVFDDVVRSKEPDFPFSLCWANHSWYSKTWDPSKRDEDKLLIEQTYPGEKDFIAHFKTLLPAFKDKRYMRNNGKLLFGIFSPMDFKQFKDFKKTWNRLAIENNLPEFHFFGYTINFKIKDYILNSEYDSAVMDYVHFGDKFKLSFKEKIIRELFNRPKLFKYKEYVDFVKSKYKSSEIIHPCIIPNFDHSPRSHKYGKVFNDSTPRLWRELLKFIFSETKGRASNLIFIKSWNEWGEGNYLEPDLKFGLQYLETIKETKQ
jgi:hypothetical protein